MNLIFLDFDGVLNDPYWLMNVWPRRRKCGARFEFDLNRIENLHKICDVTNALLVLSSSWNGRKGLKEYFTALGFRVAGRLGSHTNRGIAIKEWFDKHPCYQDTNYIIIDDEKSDYDETQLKHLIYTRVYPAEFFNGKRISSSQVSIGLSEACAKDALNLLEKLSGESIQY